MKKEDFFEVLGELDDDIVKGAKITVKKKMNWKIWGAIAACFSLVLSIGAFVLNTLQGGDARRHSQHPDNHTVLFPP